MHNRRFVDFFNAQKNSLFELLFGSDSDMFQKGSGHFTKKCLNQIGPGTVLGGMHIYKSPPGRVAKYFIVSLEM